MSKQRKQKKPREISFVELSDGRLVEAIYDPGKHPTKQFAVYNPKRDEVEYSSALELPDGEKAVPLQTSMLDKQVVLLPSDVESYGSDSGLLEEIRSFTHRYLDVSPFFEKVAGYYIILSWVHDRFTAIPYLRVIGDPGTGKSRFLQIVGMLLYKPMFASGATTPSPIFRLIEMVGGSLIVDEADLKSSELVADIVKIYNCGYQKGFPVLRTEGEKHREVRAYDVYGPKILATRQRFRDPALESRMITQEMEGEPRPDIPLVLPQDAWEEALVLRNKLLFWRFRNYSKVSLPDQDVLEGIEPRLKQILLPLIGVIDDPEVLEEIREFAKSYQEQLISDRGMEKHVEVLEAIVDLTKYGKDLTMKNIAEKLNESVDIESGEKKVTPHRVGQINRNYLRLRTRRVSGRYQIIWEVDKIRKLCARYGVEFPFGKAEEDDIVAIAEEIFGVKAESMEKSPKSTKSPQAKEGKVTLVT